MSALFRHAPTEWQRLASFLRRPTLPDRADIDLAGTVRALPALFALDMLLMAAVLGAIGLAVLLGFQLPEHMLGEMAITPGLIALIVIAAPIGEEVLFRSWLSGRPGHVLAVVALLAALTTAIAGGGGGAISLIGAGLGLAVAIAALVVFRGRNAMPWVQRHFVWFFYASALIFAGVHLTNFAAAPSPALLALVVPQFVLALILGYLRVQRGLMAGAALHMLHNAVFAGVMITGSA